jgi:hypothetical protein
MTEAIAGMPPSGAQVAALEALGRHYLSDREALRALTRLYAETPSPSVQSAIAGVLIRADHRALASPELLQTLTEKRRPSPDGHRLLDALIRNLQAS